MSGAPPRCNNGRSVNARDELTNARMSRVMSRFMGEL